MKNGTARKIIMAIAAAVFLFSSAMVLNYNLQMRAYREVSESISEMVVMVPSVSTEQEPATQDAAEVNISHQTEPTEEIVKEPPPIQVDFEALCAQNQDVVAWIYCPDTPINYPIVQASDNDTYLHRLLNGSYNTAGTLFMDYRNEADLSDWNTIIYGHNMKNDSMFGTLTDYKHQKYYDAHPVMYLLTPEENYKISILAGFVTPANGDVYNAFNPEEDEKAALIADWIKNSSFHGDSQLESEYRIITLSTCSYEFNNARYVVVGLLEVL